jgi:hypothetical protein
MDADWSWVHSAKDYVKIYEEILGRVHGLPAQSSARERAAAW